MKSLPFGVSNPVLIPRTPSAWWLRSHFLLSHSNIGWVMSWLVFNTVCQTSPFFAFMIPLFAERLKHFDSSSNEWMGNSSRTGLKSWSSGLRLELARLEKVWQIWRKTKQMQKWIRKFMGRPLPSKINWADGVSLPADKRLRSALCCVCVIVGELEEREGGTMQWVAAAKSGVQPV